jgi:hypothetical protein
MDEQETPAVVQAVMRHSKMDMTLYYSHSQRRAKRAAQEKIVPLGNLDLCERMGIILLS